MRIKSFKLRVVLLIALLFSVLSTQYSVHNSFSENTKAPNVAGAFYPKDAKELSGMIEHFLAAVPAKTFSSRIFALISPHAGYVYSGPTAAYGYKLVQGRQYKTVIVIGTSHYEGFSGISIYPEGGFSTPLGEITIDKEFAQKLLNKDAQITFEPRAFEREHSVEVQLPFLQKVLSDFKIVTVVMGDCEWEICKKFAFLLKEAIGSRQDILIIVSTDMYHGYDYQETAAADNRTISYLKNMDAEGLYNGLREGRLQLCGGFPAVTTLILAKELGYNKLDVLKYTNSAEVTGKKIKGIWTVGYVSCVINQEGTGPVAEEERGMLNIEQRNKLLDIARKSIENHLKTGKKLALTETDLILMKEMGAFVTLRQNGELRGCIGNLVGNQPLYLTIRDMAIEAAVGDPRFTPLKLNELKNIEIEISVLSPMERVDSADKIQLGVHGVLVRRGFNSGVFLPQVATETGWTKEEFLSNLCAHKAGLSSDSWKDKATQLYIFTAEVFSEE